MLWVSSRSCCFIETCTSDRCCPLGYSMWKKRVFFKSLRVIPIENWILETFCLILQIDCWWSWILKMHFNFFMIRPLFTSPIQGDKHFRYRDIFVRLLKFTRFLDCFDLFLCNPNVHQIKNVSKQCGIWNLFFILFSVFESRPTS